MARVNRRVILGTGMLLFLVLLSQFNLNSLKAGPNICKCKSCDASCITELKHSVAKEEPSEEASALEKRMIRGTFVFLVQGAGSPSLTWIDVSRLNLTHVIWVSWNETASVKSLPSTMQLYFLPGSTFTRGRNFLWKKALEMEVNQGWSFEYLVFCDEDITGMTVQPGNVKEFRQSPIWEKTQTMTNSLKTLVFFQYLLLEHRPARAGVKKEAGAPTTSGVCESCCFQVSETYKAPISCMQRVTPGDHWKLTALLYPGRRGGGYSTIGWVSWLRYIGPTSTLHCDVHMSLWPVPRPKIV